MLSIFTIDYDTMSAIRNISSRCCHLNSMYDFLSLIYHTLNEKCTVTIIVIAETKLQSSSVIKFPGIFCNILNIEKVHLPLGCSNASDTFSIQSEINQCEEIPVSIFSCSLLQRGNFDLRIRCKMNREKSLQNVVESFKF